MERPRIAGAGVGSRGAGCLKMVAATGGTGTNGRSGPAVSRRATAAPRALPLPRIRVDGAGRAQADGDLQGSPRRACVHIQSTRPGRDGRAKLGWQQVLASCPQMTVLSWLEGWFDPPPSLREGLGEGVAQRCPVGHDMLKKHPLEGGCPKSSFERRLHLVVCTLPPPLPQREGGGFLRPRRAVNASMQAPRTGSLNVYRMLPWL